MVNTLETKQNRSLRTLTVVTMIALISPLLFFAAPSDASRGQDRQSRSSIPCSIRPGNVRCNGTGNTIIRLEPFSGETKVFDSGGVDQIVLPIRLTDDVRFQISGLNDLIVRYPDGRSSVKIEDFFRRGRMEAIRFVGGDRIRFSNERVVVDGPAVRQASASGKARAASSLNRRLLPDMSVESSSIRFVGTITASAPSGFTVNKFTIIEFVTAVPPTFGRS